MGDPSNVEYYATDYHNSLAACCGDHETAALWTLADALEEAEGAEPGVVAIIAAELHAEVQERTGNATRVPGLHIACTWGRFGDCPEEWIARAYRGGKQVALGYGPTQIDAVEHVARVLRDLEQLRDAVGTEAPVFSAERDQRTEAAE